MLKKLIPHKVVAVYEKEAIKDVIPDGISMIHAPGVWKAASYGADIVVAVIDTGIDKTHPDLKERIAAGKDFTGSGDYQDDHGHGTHVSGTIAASLDGQGVVGAAPSVKILALKALNANGEGEAGWINQALDYATNWKGKNGEKVNIISMSLGGPKDETEHQLIKKAVSRDILVICAAGNSGDGRTDTSEYAYPGAYPEVVEVGAVDFNGRLADFSNTNNQIDLVAPGVDIISCYPGGRYAKMSGTSMATPHVSGAAALIKKLAEKEYERTLTEAELYAELLLHAKDLGISKKAQGHGLVDLAAGEPAGQQRQLTLTIESSSLNIFQKTVTIDL